MHTHTCNKDKTETHETSLLTNLWVYKIYGKSNCTCLQYRSSLKVNRNQELAENPQVSGERQVHNIKTSFNITQTIVKLEPLSSIKLQSDQPLSHRISFTCTHTLKVSNTTLIKKIKLLTYYTCNANPFSFFFKLNIITSNVRKEIFSTKDLHDDAFSCSPGQQIQIVKEKKKVQLPICMPTDLTNKQPGTLVAIVKKYNTFH